MLQLFCEYSLFARLYELVVLHCHLTGQRLSAVSCRTVGVDGMTSCGNIKQIEFISLIKSLFRWKAGGRGVMKEFFMFLGIWFFSSFKKKNKNKNKIMTSLCPRWNPLRYRTYRFSSSAPRLLHPWRCRSEDTERTRQVSQHENSHFQDIWNCHVAHICHWAVQIAVCSMQPKVGHTVSLVNHWLSWYQNLPTEEAHIPYPQKTRLSLNQKQTSYMSILSILHPIHWVRIDNVKPGDNPVLLPPSE